MSNSQYEYLVNALDFAPFSISEIEIEEMLPQIDFLLFEFNIFGDSEAIDEVSEFSPTHILEEQLGPEFSKEGLAKWYWVLAIYLANEISKRNMNSNDKWVNEAINAINNQRSILSYGRKWCLTELKKAAYQVEMVVCKQPIQLRRYATMSKHNVVELAGREKIRDELTDLIREGACKLIAQGLELEVSELLSALSGRQDEAGRAAVVRKRLSTGARYSDWHRPGDGEGTEDTQS